MSGTTENWKKEINELSAATDVSREDVCDYLGVRYKNAIGWYKRVPAKRETLIGIGMAYGRDLDLSHKLQLERSKQKQQLLSAL